MEKRKLGRSDVAITPLMLGTNVMGWNADEATSHAVLDAFVDLGGNAIDTADVYSAWAPGHEGGESERVIGAWLKKSGKRNKVVVATKVGMWPKRLGLKRQNILDACDDSLSRLGIETIDLYQLHRDDEATPAEEYLAALGELQKAGKVRAIGASNFKAGRLGDAMRASNEQGLPRFATLQPEYNLLNREIEADLGPLCVKEEISLIPYYGLANGYLTGKYRTEADKSKSIRGGRMDKYMQGKGPAVLAALDAIGARLGATPGQVALAWLMAKPAMAAPIASATSVAQITELMGALKVKLSATDVAELDKASA
ncbi:aldo/keto reductase [Terricaulis sp.]|uniref:aldo/keto reductase n=1 Tax=Terricaulis sp. TaxID=2768686 RepID=UPI003782F5E0